MSEFSSKIKEYKDILEKYRLFIASHDYNYHTHSEILRDFEEKDKEGYKFSKNEMNALSDITEKIGKEIGT